MRRRTQKHDRRSEDTRKNEIRQRIVAECLECIDLLGDAHGSELRGDVGADSAGECETGEDGRQLEGDRLLDECADEVQRNGAGERVAREQREDDSRERRDEECERQRCDAELHRLQKSLWKPCGDVAHRCERLADEA